MEQLLANQCDSPKEKSDLIQAIQGGEVIPLQIMGMGMDFTSQELVAASLEKGIIASLSGAIPGYNLVRDSLKDIPSIKKRIELSHNQNEAELLSKVDYVRERHPNKILGVNLMKALSDYKSLVHALGKSGKVDILYVGAGIPSDLPVLMKEYPHMHYVPIVSSARVAAMIMKKANREIDGRSVGNIKPLAFQFENPLKAGGHLGDNLDAILEGQEIDLARLREEIAHVAPGIPVIYTGGVSYRGDIDIAHDAGYEGVGIGTRGLITQESGMPNHILEHSYLNPDVPLKTALSSPAGLPSRYLEGEDFVRSVAAQERDRLVALCVSCIGHKNCGFVKGKTDYCIADLLSAARRGEEGGMLFTGSELLVIRGDYLYTREGRIYIPTISEMIDFILNPNNKPNLG